jgi:hypothetical protein
MGYEILLYEIPDYQSVIFDWLRVRGVSQVRLAKMAGVSRPWLNDMLNLKNPNWTRAKVQQVLDAQFRYDVQQNHIVIPPSMGKRRWLKNRGKSSIRSRPVRR